MENEGAVSSFMKVLVSDGERSARFYEGLGFERVQSEPPFLHLKWRGTADVYLVSMPSGVGMEARRGVGVLLGFRTGEGGVDAVAARAAQEGVSFDGPTLQPWHTREIVITDPDGYRLNFIEPA
ncbi:Glyoxalase/Bleomycin resistance protein/Dioxygenase superfamily protein [Stigmatella aurantiaca]|uniref:Glyoxalase/Bleomycin resistance protein/Dioxygenase superfamily protein n=1 Tax=Stigmatella aurantiaca TaxID=41 RepID=A0A1H7Q631_STIAU|nr:Glyoxalase/Bleomycin resistance protein/Dioxygenase superfamily protein [Stigmatella aurantiaca]